MAAYKGVQHQLHFYFKTTNTNSKIKWQARRTREASVEQAEAASEVLDEAEGRFNAGTTAVTSRIEVLESKAAATAALDKNE